MEESYRKDWIAPSILILSILGLIIIFFAKPKGIEIDSNLFVGSLTALLGLLGLTFQMKTTKEIEAKRRLHELELNHRNTIEQIRMRSYDTRKKTYQLLLQPFTETFILQKRGEQPDIQKHVEIMIKSNIEIFLSGSDETCRAWLEWKALASKGIGEDKEIRDKRFAAMMVFYARMILSIRRDLGEKNTEINEMDILKSFMSDIDEKQYLFNKALSWKTASEVP